MSDPIYFGSIKCQEYISSGDKKGQRCDNFAYYKKSKKYVCGVHSKGYQRTTLPKNPNAAEMHENQLKYKQKLVYETAEKNKKEGKKGNIICSKMKMMKSPPYNEGYLKVFPNYKHQNRSDGFGCASLSPKSMGPIDHGMPGLPIAKNLENFHQFSKVFATEVDKNGDPTEEFRELRIRAFDDPIPHRHKFEYPEIKKIVGENGNVNKPLYSVFSDEKGNEKRFQYTEARYFYCKWYQKFALKDENFLKLKNMIDEGINLQITGFDAYDVENRDLYDCYVWEKKPFGHEMVLYTLLTVSNPSDYPWNKYYEQHKEKYFQ